MDRFANKTGGNVTRQMVCAMIAALDDGIGNVTAALKARYAKAIGLLLLSTIHSYVQAAGIYDDTLIIFTSDNGGPENNNEGTWSSNYPLRGGKNTLWTGGTRVSAAITGAYIQIFNYS